MMQGLEYDTKERIGRFRSFEFNNKWVPGLAVERQQIYNSAPVIPAVDGRILTGEHNLEGASKVGPRTIGVGLTYQKILEFPAPKPTPAVPSSVPSAAGGSKVRSA
jgi:hypothetical protein